MVWIASYRRIDLGERSRPGVWRPFILSGWLGVDDFACCILALPCLQTELSLWIR
jgi:hypothetical protein